MRRRGRALTLDLIPQPSPVGMGEREDTARSAVPPRRGEERGALELERAVHDEGVGEAELLVAEGVGDGAHDNEPERAPEGDGVVVG